jgi:probable HAF family extracellular repeat protein
MSVRGLFTAAVAFVAIGVFAVADHRALAADQSRYVAIELGTLGGDAMAWAINEHSQVAVQCANRSFVWDKGAKRDLGAMAAWGINDDGDVVGEAGGHAVVWDRGVLSRLPTPAGIGFSVALAINNRGQIAGVYQTSDRVEHACLWDHGVMTDLGAPAVTPPYARALGINESGQILGYSSPDANTRCVFIWQQRVLRNVLCRPWSQFGLPVGITDQGEVAVTGVPSTLLTHAGTIQIPVNARGISPNGLVACEFSPQGQTHACLWNRGVVTDLEGSLPGLSVALAANTHAELAGWYYDPATKLNHAVLWRPADRDVRDHEHREDREH